MFFIFVLLMRVAEYLGAISADEDMAFLIIGLAICAILDVKALLK